MKMRCASSASAASACRELKPRDLSAPVQAQGADAQLLFDSRCARAAAGEPQVFEWLHHDAPRR